MTGRSRRRRQWWIGWYALTVSLAGSLAATAVFGRGPARTETYADFFGNWAEPITSKSNGIFQLHGAASTAEHVAWDVLTLFVLAPMLLLATWAVARDSVRARVVATGGLIAIVLQQRAYLGTWATDSPAGLVSLLVLVLAFVGSVRVGSQIDGRSVADDLTLVSSRPVRPSGSPGIGVLLVVVCLLFGRSVLPSSASVGRTFVGLPVSAWSVALVVAVVMTFLLGRSVLGELLAAILLVTAVVLGLGNVVMVVAAWVASSTARPLELLIALVVTAASGGGLWLAERRLSAAEAAAARPAAAGRCASIS
jgi:hypothetical protein